MGDEFIALQLNNLERRVWQLENTTHRRILRDSQDPFDMQNRDFIKLFRISKEMTDDIIERLEPALQPFTVRGLSPEKQVLIALRFYAVGCYQRAIGEQWGLTVSQPTVSRCIRNVTNAINNTLFRQNVRFPMTPAERSVARNNFRDAPSSFPGAIGAIDCTHIAIVKPTEHEESFMNHHGYHSLNVQMISDPNLKILNVNARYPGARHDSYIWNASPVRKVMKHYFNNGERHTYLIGDQGYPLEPWLMTPLPNEMEGSPKYRYNEQLCKARNCVERLFGVLKSRWRCLSGQRVLYYDPGMAGKIVNACAVLHNMAIEAGLENVENILENEDIENRNEIVQNFENRPLAVAKRIQDRLINDRFR